MKPTPPDVPWGVIDQIVATVAPRTAARRYAARVAIANLRRGYDAAARGRGTDGWRAGSTDSPSPAPPT